MIRKNKLFTKRSISMLILAFLLLSLIVPLIKIQPANAAETLSIMGKDTIGGTATAGSTYVRACRYQASATGTTIFGGGVYLDQATTSSAYVYGVYSGNETHPITLLNQSDICMATGSTWNYPTGLPNTTITPLEYYWLATQYNDTNVHLMYDAGVTAQYAAGTPGSFGVLPSTFPYTGFGNYDRAISIYANLTDANYDVPKISYQFDPCDNLSTNGTWASPESGNSIAVETSDKLEGTGAINITYGVTSNFGGLQLKVPPSSYFNLNATQSLSFSIKLVGSIPTGARFGFVLKTTPDWTESFWNLSGVVQNGVWVNTTLDLRQPTSGLSTPALTQITRLGFFCWDVRVSTPFSLLIDNFTVAEGDPLPLTVALSPSGTTYGVVGYDTPFTVTTSGTGTEPFTYAWYVNGTVQASTISTFTYPVDSAGTFNITAKVADALTSASTTCMLNALPAVDLSSNYTKPEKTYYLNEIRGAFIHTWGYITNNWTLIAQNCKALGLNTIYIELYTENVWNPSTHETQIYAKLNDAVAAIHAQDMKAVACLTVTLSAQETTMRAQTATGASSTYGSPANSAFKNMCDEIATSLTTEYGANTIDGFVWDYIRYTSQDYDYAPATIDSFEAALGLTVTSTSQIQAGGAYWWQWLQWRMSTVDSIVYSMRNIMVANKPDMEFGASVFPAFSNYGSYQPYVLAQHSAYWVSQGWIDYLCPMMYTDDLTGSLSITDYVTSTINFYMGGQFGKVPLVPFISTSNGLSTSTSNAIPVDTFVGIVQLLRQYNCGGYIVWRYGGDGLGSSTAVDIKPFMISLNNAGGIPNNFVIQNYSLTYYGSTASLNFTTSRSTSVTLQVSNTGTNIFNATTLYGELGRYINITKLVYNGGTNYTSTGTSHSFAFSITNSTEYRLIITASDDSMITPVKNVLSTATLFSPYTATVSIVNPTSSLLQSSTLNYQVTYSGNDTSPTYQINLYKSGVPVGSNRTALSGTFSGLSDGSYLFAVASLGEHGSTDYKTVSFTVSVASSSYPIIATAGSGGSISPYGTINVLSGNNQTFTITPNLGYHITSIIVDGSPVTIATSYTFTNVIASHTITANFAVNTSTITASADANCILSPSGAIAVNYGDSQSFSYSANTGYQITTITIDGVPTSISSPSGTYVFSNVITNHTISITSEAVASPTPTPTPTAVPSTTSSPNPFNHPTQILNLYFRSDTYNFSTISAYGLDTDYTNSYVSIPLSTTTTNATITYGFRVFLAVSATEYREVTSGTQIGLITVNGNFTGQLASSWNCPDTIVVLGSEALKIDIYAKIDNGSWTIQSTYVSNALMTKELIPATWSFTLNLAMSQLEGNTTSVLTFGDTDHRSTITGITMVVPNYTDIQGWQWLNGDIIGLILGSYLNVMGGAFYILIFLGIFGSLWFRHRSVGPVVFIVILLGGAGGLSCWVLLPAYAAAIFSVLIILAMMALIFKVIR